MISYEISLGLVILPIVAITGSLNFYDIIFFQLNSIWFIIPFYPSFFFFLVILLAETNRAPFDLPEAEAELVAGYNIEYGSVYFALFFLGEYNNILLGSAVQAILFLGGFALPFNSIITNFFLLSLLETFFFTLKIVFLCFVFILIRALLPRYRYDHLMQVG
jgi:NADH-quinone oxidoreductase subunit H